VFLSDLSRGERARVQAIETDDRALKNRLSAFGVMRGEVVVLKSLSIGKQTMEIVVGSTTLALRLSEAKMIAVEPLG
jgi:ferrous iron transport protein A